MKQITNLIFYFIIVSLLSVACTKTIQVHRIDIAKQDTSSIKAKGDSLLSLHNNPDSILKEPNKYFLIMGSFANKQNAENLQNELIQNGFKSQIFARKSKANTLLYNVSYKNFKDKTKADTQLAIDKQKLNKPDIWLFTK